MYLINKYCVMYIYTGACMFREEGAVCVITSMAHFSPGSGRVWGLPGMFGIFCHP